MVNNLVALTITFVLALIWLRLNDFAAQRGWISGHLSRKLIHIGTGPIFVLCWLLFRDTPEARYLAALVPLLFTIQFFLIGIGVIHDPASVQAMSRTGNPREILQGPLIYGIVFVVITILFWKMSPIGIVALMILCGGDGLADIVGRRWGRIKLPWNSSKSWIGSLGMFFGGLLTTLLVLVPYVLSGVFPQPFSAYLLPTALICLGATLVESLPIEAFDNITIPLTAIILGFLLF